MKLNKRMKLGVTLAIILVIISSIFLIVNADNSKSYVVDVINPKDTEEDKYDNTEIQIQKSIVKDNTQEPYYDDKNLTYQIDVSNIMEVKTPEIALIVDTSYSMGVNDDEVLMKAKAIELVKEIYSSCKNAKIQLFNASGAKTNKLASSGQTTIINTINSLNSGDGNDIAEAINVAKTSFTASDSVDKYIILFTDATDYVAEEFGYIDSNGIKLISVLVNNIVSNNYINEATNKATVGKVEMVYSSSATEEEKIYEEFNKVKITDIINNSLLNIEVTDTFIQPLNEFFDFELITTTEENNIEKTENGFIWKIERLKYGEKATLKYRLNIKEGIDITDTQYKYHDLVTSDSLTAKYEMEAYESDETVSDVVTVPKKNIPVIQICEKYSITFKAVSEENNNLPIEGIEFDVIAKDVDGSVVYNQTLVTDSNGKIVADNLKTEGTVHFEITPKVNIDGYSQTDTVEIDISNHNGTGFVVETQEFKDKCVIEEDRRNVTVSIPINTQKFKLQVQLTELNNSNVVIGSTEFRLIQPKLNNKYEMQAKFAETDGNGEVVFYPTVMTKAGTYEYILSQTTVQEGFISMGNATIKITFDDEGKIVENGIKVIHNENTTGEWISEEHVLIKAKNATEKDDTFNLELRLVDEDNSTIKLDGAEYDIEVTRTSNGNEVTNTYYKNITNEKGKVLIDLPGKGNVQLKITQVKAKTGYNIDSDPKIITLLREDGTVQEIMQAYNENSLTSVDASAYSSENKVIVNLTNEIKHERNFVEIKLTDIEENDVIIPGVELQLIDDMEQQVYSGITDIYGISKIQIDEKTQGNYPYTLKVINKLPSVYDAIADLKVSIHFDENGHIDMVSDLWDDDSTADNPLYDLGVRTDNGEFLDHCAYINVGATVNEANTYWLQVNLTDSETKVGLQGAAYNITITSGDIVRNITGRKTDASGNIKTRIILNEEINIEVTQTESISKYKLDNSTKEIALTYINNKLSLADSTITNTTISGNTVLYKHTNIKKSGDDVLLDLTINKEDTEGSYIESLPVRIYQESQGQNTISTVAGYTVGGINYGSWIEKSGDSNQPIALEDSKGLDVITKTDSLGTIVLKGLKVNNVPVSGEAEFILYVVEYDEVTKQDKEETKVKYKITYRYNENKEIIEITNVETTYGNRLVKEKTFNGYESFVGYQSNIFTTIYGNYEEVGNLSLDLSKLDKDGNSLVGAEYTVRALRPDGSKVTRNVTVRDGQIEVPGLMVAAGSQIEITETKAPIGYELNEATEVIEVESIDAVGEVNLNVISNNYPIARISLEKEEVYQTDAGNLKTQYSVKLIDYELDTFKIKITAKDSKTQEAIIGYEFKITSSKGALKTTDSTNGKGEVETLVGGNYANEIIEYTISTNKIAEYYKEMTSFKLEVPFNQDKNVNDNNKDNNNIYNIQTDPNYGELSNGKTWKISKTNVSEGNDIEIEVYIEPEDPLVVEIETIDALSGNKLINTAYEIQPSVLPAKGIVDGNTQNTIIDVSFVEKNVSKEYTLKTLVPYNYEGVEDQTFVVYYDQNGDIAQQPTVTSGSMQITSYNGKKMTIKNVVEPRQGIQVVNKNYFTKENITEAAFQVTTEDGRTTTINTGLTGIASMLGNKNGEANSKVKYKFHQTKASVGYATIPDFEIEVSYGQNREITDVALTNQDAAIWVNPSFIIPGSESDAGYNGNDKGIVKIEINSYYDFRINIENVDRFDSRLKIVGTKYAATSTENKSSSAETNSSGIGVAHLDELKLNKKVVYTIKETQPSIEYQPLEAKEINVEVEFDAQGFVIPSSVKVVTGYGDKYATATGITAIVNDVDKFTINLQVTSNPKFRMNITNTDYFDDTILLPGTKYTITSEVGNSIDNDVTDGNGQVTLRVDGNPKNSVIYTIHEENASAGYQTIEEDVKVEVIFNEDGTVKSCSIVQGSRFSSASMLGVVVTTFDKFTINVNIRSIELLKFNINNIYEDYDQNGNVNIEAVQGSKYKISAIEVSQNQNLNVDNSGQTDSNGLAQITMNKALSNKTIRYTISQLESAIGYKRLDYNVTIEVSFDNDGKVIDGSSKIVTDEDGNNSNNFAKITNVDIDNFEIDVEIKSNKKLSFVINNTSIIETDDGTTVVEPVVDTTFKISATEQSSNTNLNVDTLGTSNVYGIATIAMDRGLSNKTIVYTITQEKKTVGYNWLESEIKVSVSFDANGRIVDGSTQIIANGEGITANGFTTITAVKINDYEIDLQINHTPIKEFGIHLVAKDMYSQNPINGVKANAYLTENTKPNYTLVSDNKYDFSVINADKEVSNEDYKYLYTGVDRDEDGKVDWADGEDYLSMGEYLEGDNTNRTLRIILRDVPEPYQWYSNGTGATQTINIAVDIKFDDEGKIISHTLRTGHSDYVGWFADSRFVTIESTGYGLTVKLNFYPMLYVKMESQDMYTGEILDSRLHLSTSRYYDITGASDVIQEGYIGYSYVDSPNGYVYSVYSSHNYQRTARAEAGRERTFYIYEETIPRESESYYQKYRPRNYPTSGSRYNQTCIGSITVTYNDDGSIKEAKVNEYKSNNNITSGYIDLSWEGYKLSVKVKYVPTTKIEVKLVDRITGTALNNIKVYPFNLGNIKYEYYQYDKSYVTTSSTGQAKVTYWKANEPGTTRTFILGTEFNGTEYNGYFLPGDVKVDVAYNEKGRISSAQVLSNNLFGDALNAEATWNDSTLYLTIKLDRKFNLQIDKKDIYDSNQDLDVRFDVKSNKNEESIFNAWYNVPIGRIHAGEKVEYTVSEISDIEGYSKLPNFKVYVEFDDDGLVERAYVDKNYEQYFEVVTKASEATAKKGVNTKDLEIIVKNTPTLTINAELTDVFYNSFKLQDGTFTIVNSKDEKASGNLVTNANGTFSTTIGKIYTNETIKYTVNQTNVINGYKENSQVMEFEVTYDENGYIESYNVLTTSELFTIKPNIYIGTREITLNIANEPKNVNIGIVNKDATTGKGINDVEYKVEVTDVSTKNTNTISYITQNNISGDGTVAGKVDDVEKSTEYRAVRYKISEITIPNTYRKIQDVELEVLYNEDGSIASYEILSNPSEVDVRVYTKGSKIAKLNGLPTHIKLTIQNDNRYDLIIKDEDINYTGLGIEGTQYDVSINGVDKAISTTNEGGITGLYNLEGSGTITIRIAENHVGSGYRDNNQNDTTIVLEKGETVYSLDLVSNSNNTNATVVVDEERGTVTVVFKNETKLELEMLKNDVDTEQIMSGIEFEITAQEIDNYGKPVGDETIITKSEINIDTNTDTDTDTDVINTAFTNEAGKLYYDLGTTPQNKTILYTFKEINTPEGYNVLNDVKVTAKFDMYGQLQELTDNSSLAHAVVNSNNKNGIVTIIGNQKTSEGEEKINPKYTIKVATEDGITNKRINGAKFDITISKDDGTEILKQEGLDTKNVEKNGYLLEKGVVSLDSIQEGGNIIIDVDQVETTEGYEFSAKTSGTVKVNVEYTQTNDSYENLIDITLLDSDGFDVIIDNTNREIIIKVKNVPGVTLNIDKYYETFEINEDSEAKETIKIENPLQGAKFTITSEIQTSTDIISTDLNKETKSTNEEGKLTTTIGEPYAGKNIIYTLKEIVPDGFEPIEDIIILVKYNTSGNIKYAEVLSDEDVVEITDSGKGTKEMSIRVKNTHEPKNETYKVILRKHSINNDEYEYFIPDTKFEITVQEEYGTVRTWTDTTDSEGKIESVSFSGYGRIKIIYREIEAAEGYQKDENIYEIEVNRNKETGVMSPITSNENFNLDYEENIIYIDPQNDLQHDRYDLMINKVDASNNKFITDNSAAFKVSLIETQTIIKSEIDENGEVVDNEETQEIESLMGATSTDSKGRANLTAIQMPEEEGTYKLKITETKAPEGYKADEEGYFLSVTFERSSDGDMQITNVENLSEKYIDILKTSKQLIGINIKNEKDILAEDEFTFDITKIDSDTKEAIIEKEAIFRLTDEEGNKQYIETNLEDGKLLMPSLKVPEDSEFIIQDEEDVATDDGDTATEEAVATAQKTYELQEIMAPEGYLINTEPISIKVTFAKDVENKTIIQNIEVTQGENALEVSEENQIITFNVENTEGQLVNNVDRGKYTINLSKIDGDTGNPVTGHATFEVTLENGEKITASTDDDGNIQIKDIKVPSTVVENLGPYSYVIQETKPADGYELIDGFTIMELTFKELLDPDTGETTGLYGIDNITNIPVITVSDSAIITSYTEEEVNITISNKLSNVVIKYDANCDDETVIVPEDQIKVGGQDITLDTMVPEREGYTFKGWATKAEATEAEYQPGDVYTKHEDITLYAVWDEELYLKSTEYLIGDAPDGYKIGVETEYKDGDMYISRILPRVDWYHTERTTVKIFKSNITTNADTIEIIDKDGNVIGEDENVGTEMTLKLTKGDKEITITLVVMGDVIKDTSPLDKVGTTRVNDVTTIKEYLAGNIELTDIQKLAGDVDCSGEVSINDVTILNYIIAGTRDKDTGELADFSNLMDIYKK